MEEKRKFVRIDWPIVVRYKTAEEPITQDQIVGKDISEDGVSFTVYEKLRKEADLDIEIHVPFDSMPIFAKAKVMWIRKVGEEHTKVFEVGVKFVEVDPRDQKRLRAYISNEIKTRKSR